MNHFVEQGERKEEYASAFIEENLTIMCCFSSSMLREGESSSCFEHSIPQPWYSFKMHDEWGEKGQSKAIQLTNR